MKTKTMFEGYKAKRTTPVNLADEHTDRFEREFERFIDPVLIFDIRNASMLPNGRIFRNFRYLRQSDIVEVGIRARLSDLRSAYLRPAVQLSDDSVYYSFINSNWNGYFHWFADCLQRLYIVRKKLGYLTVLMPQSLSDYQVKSLEAFDIRSYVNFAEDKTLRIPRLQISSKLARSGNYNRHVLPGFRRFMLDHFTGSSSTPGMDKIYISRRRAPWRKVINEAAVEHMLKEFGYTSVIMEDYDFAEQIRIMNRTSHIISLHGAGLTNMLFLPENARVLEIRHEEDNFRNCYYTMASDLSLPYYYILGRSERPEDSFHVANLFVDIEDLRDVVRQMDA